VVLHFDGDSRGQLRMVRALKNRFGPTDEFGCFELGESGLVELPDPSGLFLSQRHDPVPGTCVTVTLEGRRPLLAEVQALVGPVVADLPPRRVVSGLDSARVGMMLAVLQRRARLQMGRRDVFAATVGGVRLTEPSVDLAVGLAAASALADISVPADLVAIGEIGLAGEIRRVTGIRRRLAEAERMGFRRAIIPAGSDLMAPAGSAIHGPASGGQASSCGATGRPANGRPANGDSSRHHAIDAAAGGQLEITEVTDIRGAITAALGLQGSGGNTLAADRDRGSWLDCP
jgi:DNA repair protein RadA/Sms